MVGFLAGDCGIDCPTYPVAEGGSGAGGGQWEVYNLGSAVDAMYISPEGHIFGYVGLCTKSPVREMTRWSMRPGRSVFNPILRSNRSH